MRGGLKYQILTAIKCIVRIGESRHEAKMEGSTGLHSISTTRVVIERCMPLRETMRELKAFDLEKLNAEVMRHHLQTRLEHHVQAGNALKTFQCELSALSKLEQALTEYSRAKRGDGAVKYDFSMIRKEYSKLASESLARQTNPYKDRAIPNPQAVIQAIQDPTHRLQARLQLEAGIRAEGAGAPKRLANPLREINFKDPKTLQPLGLVKDPLTGKEVAKFWTKEKGGKVAFHYCPPELKNEVLAHIREHGGLQSKYDSYLASLNAAMKATGQAAKGRGSHALRHCYAQARYSDCVRHGYSDSESKQLVSYELSHNRPDITEVYLK